MRGGGLCECHSRLARRDPARSPPDQPVPLNLVQVRRRTRHWPWHKRMGGCDAHGAQPSGGPSTCQSWSANSVSIAWGLQAPCRYADDQVEGRRRPSNVVAARPASGQTPASPRPAPDGIGERLARLAPHARGTQRHGGQRYCQRPDARPRTGSTLRPLGRLIPTMAGGCCCRGAPDLARS